jgi:hypothetical protein
VEALLTMLAAAITFNDRELDTGVHLPRGGASGPVASSLECRPVDWSAKAGWELRVKRCSPKCKGTELHEKVGVGL